MKQETLKLIWIILIVLAIITGAAAIGFKNEGLAYTSYGLCFASFLICIIGYKNA